MKFVFDLVGLTKSLRVGIALANLTVTTTHHITCGMYENEDDDEDEEYETPIEAGVQQMVHFMRSRSMAESCERDAWRMDLASDDEDRLQGVISRPSECVCSERVRRQQQHRARAAQ